MSTSTESPIQLTEPAGRHVRLRIRIPKPHETFRIFQKYSKSLSNNSFLLNNL